MSFDPARRFISSPFFSSPVLATIRVLFALFGLATTLTVLALTADPDYRAKNGQFVFYSYFTSLSFIGLTSYYVAAATHTGVFVATKGRKYLLADWGRVLQTMYEILFATISTFPIVVTVVFWTLLSSPDTFATPLSSFSSIVQHACNTPFALFEILLTNAPPLRWIHLPVCVVLLGLYLCVAYITHASQGVYVYNFLDPNITHGRLAAYIVGIAIGECVVFALVKGLMTGREALVRKYWPERAVTLGTETTHGDHPMQSVRRDIERTADEDEKRRESINKSQTSIYKTRTSVDVRGSR
ncbi:hypothetical protein HGRIS_014642 [Hohenbuehelia grisea]|uniref:FAR-17a/AIG1-like protein n=1 Tax=Hohenbuehelia grisea TaxID=104357 RepID=A0ABR3JVW0_9AGAR